MLRSTTKLITFVGVIYLCLGLVGSIFPIMLLLSKPSLHLLTDSLLYIAVKLITVGPCFFIAYGWIRRKKWGRHLMIAYNALWLTYVTFALVSEMVSDPKAITGPIIVVVVGVYGVLGILIAFASQRDVRASMN